MTIRGFFAFFLVALLIVSLAANFLILGFAAARYRGFDHPGAIDRIVALGTRGFPSELRGEIGDQLGRHRGELRAALRDLGLARREMFRQMVAEPLDRAALDAAFADVRARTDRLQRLGQELVAEVLVDAPPEERARSPAAAGVVVVKFVPFCGLAPKVRPTTRANFELLIEPDLASSAQNHVG